VGSVCVVKDGMIELYIGDFKRARETHYLYSETATYDGSGKGIKGNNTEGRRRKKMSENRISYLLN